MGRTRITGVEIGDNTVKGVDVDESTLVPSLIPFSESSFTSDNIRDAIIEAKSSDSGEDNFSWRIIASGKIVNIPINQQMIVHQNIEIEAGGELAIEANGELVVCQ